jgi:hypothetical protein
MLTRAVLTLATIATLALPWTVVAPATASGGGDVRTSGSCSGAADWKLKAKPDDGRIEVEAEVDSNVAGQLWHWTLKHNGSVSASGSKRTVAPSGSFEIRRRMADLAGTDHFVVRATHAGQVCRGTIAY